MSAEDRLLEEAMQSAAPNTPRYNPMRQIPPDLVAKQQNSGTSGAAVREYAKIEGTVNHKAQPEYFRALRRQGQFITQPFEVGTDYQIVRPLESRTYFFIQNLSTSGDLYVGFGAVPNSSYALTLTPGAAYEPFTVPVNEIYLLAQNAGTTGFIIYSREAE